MNIMAAFPIRNAVNQIGKALPHWFDRALPTVADGQWRRLLDEPVRQLLDNAAMESFFSSLKTERVARKTYRMRDQSRADMFDYIERFYYPTRTHSTLGYLSPVDFEKKAGVG